MRKTWHQSKMLNIEVEDILCRLQNKQKVSLPRTNGACNVVKDLLDKAKNSIPDRLIESSHQAFREMAESLNPNHQPSS